MKIAIIHYHLNRGGVTRVIENQLVSLDAVLEPGRKVPVAILYGGRCHGWAENLPDRLQSIDLSLHVVPSLDYDDLRDDDPGAGALAGQLVKVLEDVELAPRETVVHAHNHAIGKNASLPEAVGSLAERGFATLLQVHDFAEDCRASLFQQLREKLATTASGGSWHGWLYPQASHVHYAVLNRRDRGILRAAGVSDDCLHLLPNPTPALERLPSRGGARDRLQEQFAVGHNDRFVLYPVRCIRRKNVGEALLYSKLAPPATVVGLTLPPMNPAEKPIQAAWKSLSAELDLPCRFEVGAPGGLTFTENLAASDLILTTSVAEGFGMVFLESWLAGRRLIGRDLPEITSDFVRAGICLDQLEHRLLVPVEWIGEAPLCEALREAYRATLEAFGKTLPGGLAEGSNAKVHDGLVDFADLDESFQMDVIRRVCHGESDRRRVEQYNPRIGRAFATGPEEAARLIQRNVENVRRGFSRVPSGKRLRDLYRQTLASARHDTAKPLAHPERILDSFLDFRRFRLIRSDLVRV
ncbi:MAG: glycosyltransferase family protein [Planctomycetota bacterium]|jgi:hypothetical protein